METVTMPKELTAENGAKALLIGEFYETIEHDCPECDQPDSSLESCELCNGSGRISHEIPVSWTTIKAIYKMAVEGLTIKETCETCGEKLVIRKCCDKCGEYEEAETTGKDADREMIGDDADMIEDIGHK